MSDTARLQRQKPLVLADLFSTTLVHDFVLVVAAAGLVGALAQVSFHLSFTPVPVTGQTLGVLVAGTAARMETRDGRHGALRRGRNRGSGPGSPTTRADMSVRRSATSSFRVVRRSVWLSRRARR